METKIDINAAVNFIFQDKEWVNKIVIAGVLYLTIIGSLPVLGWILEIQRRVIHEEENPLPDWSDIGAYTLNGLKLMLVNIIYTLPLTILWLLLTLIFFIPALMDDPTYFIGFWVIFSFIGTPVIMIFSIFFYAVMPITSGVFVETNSIKQTLKLSRVFQLTKANYRQLIGVALLAYVVSYAASMIGIWLCFVGIFFTLPIALGMTFHLFGQAYRNALIKLDEAPTV